MKLFHNPHHLNSIVSSIINTSKKEASYSSSPASSSKLVLYSYWQSSCRWRVRFALNLKGLSYKYKQVDLVKGEQFSPEFERLNPLHYVPVLVDGDVVISDSLAILLYLEENYPQRPLLPAGPRLKALNLQKYIEEKIGPEESLSWAQLHIGKGFRALEKLLKDFAGRFATGNEVYMTDVFLAPQIAIATARFNINMGGSIVVEKVNGLNAKLDKVAKWFDEFLDGVIQEHKIRSSKNNDDQDSHDERKDFVDVLLCIQKENITGSPLGNVSIKALILDTFDAGTDTYTILDWSMSELLTHPNTMKKLQDEVRGIAANKTEITEDDLVEMHYLNAVMKETLRLHPPVPLLMPRKARQDVKVQGFDIKANTVVIVNAWQIGRDPNSYENPDEFKPERFMSDQLIDVDYKGRHFQLIPFGAGRRACPGITFSMTLGEIGLANLVHKFDWALPNGGRGEELVRHARV